MNNTLQKLNAGTVQIRGKTIDLTSSEGQALVADLARMEESILSIDLIKKKYDFSDTDIADLAANAELERAILLEQQKRILNGSAARDAAAVYHAQAPHVLGKMLTDKLETSRNRIEAAKSLEKTATSGGPNDLAHREQVIITIITGPTPEATKVIEITPSKPLPTPEMPPIVIEPPVRPTDDPDPHASRSGG